MHSEKQPRSFYVTAPLIWPLLLGLRTLGVDVEALLDEAGLPRKMMLDPELRLSPDRTLRLVELAIERTGDQDLGIHLAERYEPGAFGTLDMLAHSATNLRAALQALCRYERIHQNGMITSLELDDDPAAIRHWMTHPYPLPRQVSENTLANLLAIGRKLTGLELRPTEVWLAHPRPKSTVEQERFFACSIRWDAPQDVLFVPREVLAAPLLAASPALAAVLDGYANTLLAKLSGGAEFTARTRQLVCQNLSRGEASLDCIARTLGLAERTLQRRLDEEGTHFGLLLDEVRSEFARAYLKSGRFGMDDIALMLGFSDTRAFRRSFRRWTGMSPSAFRATDEARD